jgi:hypothetical protein
MRLAVGSLVEAAESHILNNRKQHLAFERFQ